MRFNIFQLTFLRNIFIFALQFLGKLLGYIFLLNINIFKQKKLDMFAK